MTTGEEANKTDNKPEDKPAAPEKTEVTVALRKPIQANGETVTSLTFREPTAADIERCGNPVSIDFFSGESPRLSFDAAAMTKMMSTLAAIPPSSVRSMNTRDWNSAAWALTPFFLPEM